MKRAWAGMVLVAMAAAGGAARADSPPPFPEFTFKMGRPPAPGTTPRITVRIEPGDQPRAGAPGDAAAGEQEAGAGVVGADGADGADGARGAAQSGAEAGYGWFWSRVDSRLGADPGRRLARAFDSLDKGKDGARVAAPRLQQLQQIAAREGARILRATVGTRVSPALALAVIAVESGGRADAVSPRGAQGLMQLMPDTAARFAVADSLSPEENIRGGVAYLDWLLGEFDGDAVLALAGYHAGAGAVRAHGGVPPFADTRDYVPMVLAAFLVARGLCQTPPELITDACALRLAAN
ncbi:MAG: lytic transglycosylase domain-containing protein [Roseovarius sp.]